ncbi:MAG: M50 family metallopeptidase [Phycisphaerales bacterium]
MVKDEWDSGVGFDERRGDGGRTRAALRRVFGDGENPLSWGVTLGRLWGVRVRVHLVFVAFVALELIYALPRDGLGVEFRLWLLGGLTFVVLAHELGHVAACRLVGGEIDEVMLWPLGGLSEHVSPRTGRGALLTTLGGPLMNAALAIGLGGIVLVLTRRWENVVFNPFDPGGVLAGLRTPASEAGGASGQPWWLTALWSAHYANLLVLGMNALVPMLPLDAGRAVRDALASRGDHERTTTIASTVGFVAAGALGLVAVVFNEVALLGVALFGVLVCYLERRRARFLAMGGEDPLTRADEDRERERLLRRESERAEEQRRIDLILEKISDRGMESLSPSERRTLKRATRQSRES